MRSVRHYVGAFLVELGGVDVLTFSGGIGENSAAIREAVCAGLGELGIELDRGRNRAVRGEGRISAGRRPDHGSGDSRGRRTHRGAGHGGAW